MEKRTRRREGTGKGENGEGVENDELGEYRLACWRIDAPEFTCTKRRNLSTLHILLNFKIIRTSGIMHVYRVSIIVLLHDSLLPGMMLIHTFNFSHIVGILRGFKNKNNPMDIGYDIRPHTNRHAL